MKYTEKEMLQDVANGVLQDMETMFELADGKPKVRGELPCGWVKKQDVMIKASDIGLTKQELDEIEEFGKARKQFIDDMCAKANAWAFEQLNVPKEHTPEELMALMRYKGENIKAHVIPHIFFEVAELLKKQQEELEEYRKNKIYTEEDL